MNVEIAERLAVRRKEAGFSQESLAERLGVSRQAVSKWERSESSPDTDNLIALAKLYGVSLDDLLYVDGSIEDDIEFEAADRAAARESNTTASVDAGSGANEATSSEAGPNWTSARVAPESPEPPMGSDQKDNRGPSFSNPDSVRVSPAGVHVLDGDDYVHVSWRDGVHVKDSKKGDEVHVGWTGIHVKEGGESRARAGRGKGDNSWFVAGDDEGNTVGWAGDGVEINGEHFDTWQEAHDRYSYGGFRQPSGYTVCGERFDTLDEAKAKYGDEVGKSIPVRKHYKVSSWLKFPYPLVVIIAYLSVGFAADAWGTGLFLFFTIPAYYMLGYAIQSRRIAHFIGGLYPIAASAWFLWMAFVEGAPHPAWVIFLTIPVVEWVVHSVSRWWRRRKKEKEATVIEVEPEAQ
ncbi:MAG: helix-turn-helix domain-containing protein [Raoultibacter sp.]